MRHVQLVGICPRIGHELLEVVGGKVLPRRNHDRRDDNHPDGLEIDIGPIRQVRIERNGRGMCSGLPYLNGVAVGRGPHRPRRAGGSAGADDVLDNELLTERARHVVTDDAGTHIGWTARREWNDDGDRSRGIGLRTSPTRQRRQCRNARGELQESLHESTTGKVHGVSPPSSHPAAWNAKARISRRILGTCGAGRQGQLSHLRMIHIAAKAQSARTAMEL